jgi:hypothetical protein
MLTHRPHVRNGGTGWAIDKTYESMQAMKDHVEPANLPSGKVQVPVPDSTNGYLRRRQASNSEDGDLIWYVNTPPHHHHHHQRQSRTERLIGLTRWIVVV